MASDPSASRKQGEGPELEVWLYVGLKRVISSIVVIGPISIVMYLGGPLLVDQLPPTGPGGLRDGSIGQVKVLILATP